MKLKPKRIARNVGRIEFIACKGEIYSMLQTGYDNKKIFETLRERKNITMAYSTLCYHIAKSREQQECGIKNKARCCAQDKQESSRNGYASNGFSINKKPSADDMI